MYSWEPVFNGVFRVASLSLTILDIFLNFLYPEKALYPPDFDDIFIFDCWSQLLTRFKSVCHLAHNQWGFLHKLTEKTVTTVALLQRSFLAVSFIHFKTIIIHNSSLTKPARQSLTAWLPDCLRHHWLCFAQDQVDSVVPVLNYPQTPHHRFTGGSGICSGLAWQDAKNAKGNRSKQGQACGLCRWKTTRHKNTTENWSKSIFFNICVNNYMSMFFITCR